MGHPVYQVSKLALHNVHQHAEYPGEEEHGERVGEPGDGVGRCGRGEGDEERRAVAEEVTEAAVEDAAHELRHREHRLDLPVDRSVRAELLGQVLQRKKKDEITLGESREMVIPNALTVQHDSEVLGIWNPMNEVVFLMVVKITVVITN